MLPGIGPSTGIALLIPLTFTMSPDTALVTMCAIYYGAMFGGSRSSILINVPGDGASVASCFDGYPNGDAGTRGSGSRHLRDSFLHRRHDIDDSLRRDSRPGRALRS